MRRIHQPDNSVIHTAGQLRHQVCRPEVHVVFDCIIGRREGRDVVASFSAAGSALATANRLGEVVAAFEQATGTALAALSQQAQAAARAAAQPPAARAAQNEDSPVPSSSRSSQ